MTPVSDGRLSHSSIKASLTSLGETESGSAGTQPDKG
jgi:hypothetical protein